MEFLDMEPLCVENPSIGTIILCIIVITFLLQILPEIPKISIYDFHPYLDDIENFAKINKKCYPLLTILVIYSMVNKQNIIFPLLIFTLFPAFLYGSIILPIKNLRREYYNDKVLVQILKPFVDPFIYAVFYNYMLLMIVLGILLYPIDKFIQKL